MVWFKNLVLGATILALCVVVFGAYVRLTDAGLGCPDWPGCYGTLTVPESVAAIEEAQANYPNSIIDKGKAWIEMIHRYIAAILGLMILSLAFLAFKNKNDINVRPSLVYGLLGLVIAQGMLGMWTVTELLMPIIVSLHLLGGMTTLGLLTYITHRHWGSVSDTLITLKPISQKLIRFSLVILFIQIFLGGWTSTNYAALACTDFPTCHGELIPPMDFSNGFTLWRELGMTAQGDALTLQALQAIQWIHRIGAFIFVSYFLYIIYLMSKFKSCNLYRNLLVIVISFQFIIGVLNLLLHLPLALATMHNLGAALLVIITVIINSRITPKYG
ncbi:MAG: COX15/CtaA family protein [Betaproteobacteria bacterium]|jgi:cytochrome c oxidase assembly protein subunit 15|nr:COX15/CtaA family protein [Nitrosomonadales bacterium]MCH9771378.1 COX15/CtaA family protein [Betaproteobacteria bacterium]